MAAAGGGTLGPQPSELASTAGSLHLAGHLLFSTKEDLGLATGLDLHLFRDLLLVGEILVRATHVFLGAAVVVAPGAEIDGLTTVALFLGKGHGLECAPNSFLLAIDVFLSPQVVLFLPPLDLKHAKMEQVVVGLGMRGALAGTRHEWARSGFVIV